MTIHFSIICAPGDLSAYCVEFPGISSDSFLFAPSQASERYARVEFKPTEIPSPLKYRISKARFRDNQQVVILSKKLKGQFFKAEEIRITHELPAGAEFPDILFPKSLRKICAAPHSKSNFKKPEKATHIFSARYPLLQKHKELCMTGSAVNMGSFEPAHAIFPGVAHKRKVQIELDLSQEEFPLEYKWAIYDKKEKRITEYEGGPNRVIKNASLGLPEVLFDAPNFTKSLWRSTGVNIPLFSLRTRNSFGIGDLGDLKTLADFCGKTGIRLIQLLPINDTAAGGTDRDSYPYSAVSAFATDPKYLDVQALADAYSFEISPAIRAEFRILNQKNAVDYAEVLRLKSFVMKEIFAYAQSDFISDSAGKRFIQKSRYWLLPYAAFCVLRDSLGTDFTKWAQAGKYDDGLLTDILKDNPDQVNFVFFLQYHLHCQLKKAVRYAHKKKVILKADLPIGVGRFSADTWQHPELFHLNMQAGAPPDAFSAEGQNWGFPTYDMSAMKARDFKWFRLRLKNLARYFDAVRIDHVLGFFRIWSIPLPFHSGAAGRFVPASGYQEADLFAAGIDFRDADWCESSAESNTADGILFKEEDGYHFRINMRRTQKYLELAPHAKAAADKLYDDYFYQRQNKLWEQEGRDRLQMIRQCNQMLICAEDLGMVPAFTSRLLRENGMLSLHVQQMPNDGDKKFSDTAAAAYASVVMPATHDMPPMRLWWELHRDEMQEFFNRVLGEKSDAPYFFEPWLCKKNIALHLHSPAMWSIFLLQDILSIDGTLRHPDPRDERINDPANEQQVWNYRMSLYIEDILANENFCTTLREMIKESGR